MTLTYQEAAARVTGTGERFETTDAEIRGVTYTIFKNAPRSLRDVLAPARFVSGLFSSDLRIGFVIFNGLLVAFGLGCFFGPVLRGARSAKALAWFWVGLEFLNGCAHITWAAAAGALFVVGVGYLLVRSRRTAEG